MSRETKSLGQKDNLDRFYTKSSVVDFCLSKINLNNYTHIIEPSAGSGAFSNKIPNCIAIDIKPANDGIIACDYLAFDYSKYKGALVIGNPPFGQQSKLAIAFFNYSAKYAQTIAFILPKSFKKASMQNKLDLNFRLVEEYDIESNAFLLNGADYNVPCVFQIWDRTLNKRALIKLKTTTNLLDFTKDRDLADFRIQRVGGNAGKASFDKTAALASNYYIINKSPFTNEELAAIINSLTYPTINDTVGPKSLSKGELIDQLENKLYSNN